MARIWLVTIETDRRRGNHIWVQGDGMSGSEGERENIVIIACSADGA